MVRKVLRITAMVLLSVLTVIVLWVANGFFGNPVSWVLARTGVNRYVEQTYSHLDLHTERFGHDFKTGGYYAYLCSETSGDTAFYVRTDMLGRIRQDSFDVWVAHKYNTELRIREEYRLLADAVFQSGSIPYAMDIDYGDITFAGDEQWGEAEYDFALPRDILVLDKVYDVRELARNAGVLTVYAMDETVTVQKAAEIMLCIRSAFEEAQVPFRLLDFVLRTPMPEDGSPWPDTAVYARILYENIKDEGMEERVRESHEAIVEEYAQLDEEKAMGSTSED